MFRLEHYICLLRLSMNTVVGFVCSGLNGNV
jgi:hypothetical protein